MKFGLCSFACHLLNGVKGANLSCLVAFNQLNSELICNMTEIPISSCIDFSAMPCNCICFWCGLPDCIYYYYYYYESDRWCL